MNRRWNVLLLMAVMFMGGWSFGQVSAAHSVRPQGAPAQNPPPLPSGIQPDWWTQVQANIQREEYNITWQDETALTGVKGAWQAPNRAQGFRTCFMEDGIQVVPRAGEKPDWVWGLALAAQSGAGSWKPEAGEMQKPGIHVTQNRIEFDRGWITEWYLNSPEGLEQGFTIPSPLPAAGSWQMADGEGNVAQALLPAINGAQTGESALHIDLQLSGTLHPKFAEDGQAVDFYKDGGFNVLHYAKLIVTDATGRVLPSRFEGWAGGGPDYGLPNARARAGYEMPAQDDAPASPASGFRQGGVRISIDAHGAIYPITIDPLATTPAWTAEGGQGSAKFGNSVATAGDVNGDGYSDVIVGAPEYDNGSTNEGRAYVYLGSASGLGTSAAWTAESDQTNANFGWSVATAGDVNGDGYSDVIVGAPYYSNGSSSEGLAFVWLGSSAGLGADGTPANAEWTAESDQSTAHFGWSVATAGDVNGDGYSDVIVGAREYDSGDEGRAFVWLGSSTGLGADGTPSNAAWTVGGDQTGIYFGTSVATAGDVNGDGYSDVIVGASFYDNGSTNEGRAYVYVGSASGPGLSPAWMAESDQDNALLGSSVATAGDVNGDGYSDVIVGAHLYSNGQQYEGRAFVWLGSSTGLGANGTPANADWMAESDNNVSYFGCSVATAGDVNGDGYSDVIIGAHYLDNGQTAEGRAYVYLGSASGLGLSPAWTAESDQTNANFGWSVATAGDVNGDGYSDVIVGAHLFDNAFADEGRATVYLGSASGLGTGADWTVESDQDSSYFSTIVATAGDVNGDGYSDVIVGAPYYSNGQFFEGRAYVYLGSSSGLSTSAAWSAESDQDNASFGCSVATAGDVNGDGYSDVIVGAESYDNGQTDEGTAYVWYGSASGLGASGIPANADWTAEGNQDSAAFGISVATAGDVNGDGYSDLIIGASKYDNGSTNEGRAFVWFGSSTGLGSNGTPANAAWTAESDTDSALFGSSVATAGDVNGDGYSDVIVGAPYYTGGSANEGLVCVYAGSATGLADYVVWRAESNQAGARMGTSVGTAGDVNGDGYSDIIVGAPYYDNDTTDEGLALVWLGSSTGLGNVGIPGNADWTAESDQGGSRFGTSLGTAGDVNGDGFSDIIIGSCYFDAGSTDEGRAFVWLGSGAGLGANGTPANADWKAESDQGYAYFGDSVAMAGDVNGDGYSDVIVGAPNYDNDQYDEGRAYAYLGNGEAGRGLALNPLQRRANDGAPVDKLGDSKSSSSFRLASRGRTPFGRGKVKLEMEVKPLGTSFNGAGIQFGSSWADSGISGAYLNELVSPLSSGINYHWRARLNYNPATTPFQQKSYWFTQPWGGWQETDLRTAFTCAPPSSLTNNTAADLDCGDTGVRIAWAQDAGDWADGGLGTRTYDVLRDGSPIRTGIAYGTTSATDTTGANGIAYAYKVRYNNGCGMNAAPSGAQAADSVTPPEVTPLTLRKDASGSYPAGIVSAWHFEEGSGTTAADTPGSNDGTLVNGPIWAAGHSGTALSFDGTDKYVSVPNHSSLNPAQITVAAWIKAAAWTTGIWEGSIIAKDGWNPVDSGWVLRCGNGGALSFVVSVNGWHWIDTAPLMSLNTWTHVAGTYDGTTLRAYINGEDRGSASYAGSITPSTVSLWMGDSPGFPGRRFNGMIDDAAVFNRALTGPEIQNLYQNGFTSNDLVFGWPPLVPPSNNYEVLRAAGPQGPFDTLVGTADGASDSLRVAIESEPLNAYYKIRAVNGSCPGPF